MTASTAARDDARQVFADTGLTYSSLSRYDLELLRGSISKAMNNAKILDGYAMNRSIRMVRWPNGFAELTCKSFYFEKREAITFNPDGFIGFAGWADDKNVVPILDGFLEWVKAVSSAKAAIARKVKAA